MTKKCWKIVDKKDDDYFFLFHGLNKSKKIPFDKWITAERKMVSDGVGTKYESGFHVMLTLSEAATYVLRFRNMENKAIILVSIMGLRKKEHSTSNIYLANKMKVERP